LKKPLRGLITVWCAACGTLIPLVAVAVVVLQVRGVVDFDHLVDQLRSTAVSEIAEADVDPPSVVKPGQEITFIEEGIWRRRLETYEAQVKQNAEELVRREVAVTAREDSERTVSVALADLLTEIFEQPVSPESVLEEPTEWKRRIEAKRGALFSRPHLLETLSNIENEALAEILANREASNGLDENTVAQLMEELPAKRAGQVLTELSSKDPGLASRIIARLERVTGSSPSVGDLSQ